MHALYQWFPLQIICINMVCKHLHLCCNLAEHIFILYEWNWSDLNLACMKTFDSFYVLSVSRQILPFSLHYTGSNKQDFCRVGKLKGLNLLSRSEQKTSSTQPNRICYRERKSHYPPLKLGQDKVHQ